MVEDLYFHGERRSHRGGGPGAAAASEYTAPGPGGRQRGMRQSAALSASGEDDVHDPPKSDSTCIHAAAKSEALPTRLIASEADPRDGKQRRHPIPGDFLPHYQDFM